jgi:uncharacterized membrane protein
MSNKKCLLYFLIILLFILPPLSGAIVYDILSIDTTIDITEEGIYEIREVIELDFKSSAHGFYRVLPTRYKTDEGYFKVKVSSIKASDQLESSWSTDYFTLRIGQSDKLVQGRQAYTLSYRYDIGIDLQNLIEGVYYNIVGTQWEAPIEKATFTINFPKPLENGEISFTRGKLYSTTKEGINWYLNENKTQIVGKAESLEVGEGITVAISVDDTYFTLRRDWQTTLKIPSILISLLLIAFAVFNWYKYGRDKDLIVVAQLYPPKEMSPLDVGYIIDQTLDPRDITAMIFYWADKGSLTILEQDKEFTFVKGRDLENASDYEKELFESFFRSGNGSVVKAKQLEGKFVVTYQKLKRKVERFYSKERSLKSSTSRNKVALIVASMLISCLFYSLILTANFIGPLTLFIFAEALVFSVFNLALFWNIGQKWYIRKKIVTIGLILVTIVGSLFIILFSFALNYALDLRFDDNLFALFLLVLTNVPLAFFAIITEQRSAFGQKALEEVLGLREFINRVEMPQLKKMIDEERDYYYKILSFAIVLGLEKKWAKKFDSIMIEKPSWYQGDIAFWNAMAISSMINRCNTSLASSIGTNFKGSGPTHFKGSSFRGGGFSGGGFGGGGGGAW